MTIQRTRTGLAAALVLSMSAFAGAPAPTPTRVKPGFNLFSVEQDIVCGMTVMRDLNIDTTMSTGAKLSVPIAVTCQK